MAASLVSISTFLGSSPAPIVAESSQILDQRHSSGGGLGFMKARPPPLEIGRGGLPCCSSRFFRAGVVVFATKQKRRSSVLDMNEEIEVDDDDDDDQEDGEVTEFADMEEWMRNKPSGFGLKEYDTSLEDRLLAEIEAEKKAQAALALKKKFKKTPKAPEKQDAPPQGVEVYVGNLPRKRNVDRDLRAAFRSAQGLLHIRPIVDGNEKTREPMCKGLAFLTFASDRQAKDFIQRYNGEDVTFGKTEKKVVCELAAVNSPFKKQVSQKKGPDSPPLQVRDTTRSSSSARASPSSIVAVELRDKTNFSTVESNSSDRPFIFESDNPERHDEDIDSLEVSNSDSLEGQDEDIDSLEVSEDELIALEQEIWAELEDEDDFELDQELEADHEEEEDLTVSLNSENVRDLDTRNVVAQDRQDLGQIDVHSSDPIDVNRTENNVVVDDGEEETDTHKADSIRGRGFGSTAQSMPDAAGDKDKRIQELESKLKKLQGQLEKRQTKAKVGEHTPKSDENIEALERRLLARAKKLEKDSKPSSPKKVTGSKKQPSKVKSVSKATPSQPKLGGASRLKKKDKQLYTGVLSKYSPLEKEMAM
ncbi:unnamed protein product [Calypogeia fissa]